MGFGVVADWWLSASLAAFGFTCGWFVVAVCSGFEFVWVGWYGSGGRLVWRVVWVYAVVVGCVVICLELCFSYGLV